MRMKNILVVVIFSALWYGCSQYPEHPDGSYRGVFIDGDAIQVNVEFELKDSVVQEASFRHLRRDENYNLDAREEPYQSVIAQYREALEYLVGKNIEEHIDDLYYPGEIVEKEVDGYTAATLRTNKVRSAIRDALNRGAYSR